MRWEENRVYYGESPNEYYATHKGTTIIGVFINEAKDSRDDSLLIKTDKGAYTVYHYLNPEKASMNRQHRYDDSNIKQERKIAEANCEGESEVLFVIICCKCGAAQPIKPTTKGWDCKNRVELSQGYDPDININCRVCNNKVTI